MAHDALSMQDALLCISNYQSYLLLFWESVDLVLTGAFVALLSIDTSFFSMPTRMIILSLRSY